MSIYESAINAAIASIDKNAMLVGLSISHWSARVKDYKISKEVATNHNTTVEAGVYWKRALAKKALQEINACISEARQAFYLNTMPYPIKGYSILMAANYTPFMKTMRDVQARFDKAVNDFDQAYPAHIDEARILLNGLFNDQDYPLASEIRKYFRMHVDVLPVPVDSSFQVPVADADEIREEMRQEMSIILEKAMQDSWDKLYTVCYHMAERLEDPDQSSTEKEQKLGRKIFRDSLIDNLKEVCSILPSLNIMQDPKLEEMKKALEEKVLIHDAQMLRERPEIRRQAHEEVREIIDNMIDYLGETPSLKE